MLRLGIPSACMSSDRPDEVFCVPLGKRRQLNELFTLNRRLLKAYLLKESLVACWSTVTRGQWCGTSKVGWTTAQIRFDPAERHFHRWHSRSGDWRSQQ